MPELPVHDLALFVGAGLLLNLTPGPDMLFVAGCSVARGRRAGVLAALGVGAGCLVHVALAAFGLSALLATSALAFGIVKWLGAAYLVWTGIALLRAKPPGSTEGAGGPVPADGRRAFWQGALTNALNPKVALFFLAFLPQFIDPAAPSQALAFIVLGLVFDFGGTLVNLVVALAAGTLAARLAGRGDRGAGARSFQKAVGALFVGLGVKLALGSR